jgi:hypothetical protein
VRHVTDEQHVAILRAELVAQPLRRIVRQQPADHLELREGRARAQERLGGLARTQFSAVPDRGGRESDGGSRLRQFIGLPTAETGQRPLRIDVWSDCVGMMHK